MVADCWLLGWEAGRLLGGRAVRWSDGMVESLEGRSRMGRVLQLYLFGCHSHGIVLVGHNLSFGL